MSLDADVAAVVQGNKTQVRGILRLPTRPPPSYSAVAARQAAVTAHSATLAAQPAIQPGKLAIPAPGEQTWHTIVTRSRHDRERHAATRATMDDGGSGEANALAGSGRLDSARRRKKKAGEPPPPSLHFAELLDAQLRRAEESRLRSVTVEAAVITRSSTAQPSAALPTHSEPVAAFADSSDAVSPASLVSSARAKPTKLKRQLRQQQLSTFIQQRILTPIVRAAVAQACLKAGMATEEGDVDVGESTEIEQHERERREKKRMLRHLKRKQKRIAKHASGERPTSPPANGHSHLTATDASADGVHRLRQGERDKAECEDDEEADDELALAVIDPSLPASRPADADEDPSCPTQPYSFTDEERAFLFQHVVVDRYHSQPPLSPLVSALCQQLFSPSVDAPVAHLLLALASYQRRALSSPSPLVRARGRRMVMGLREAAKKLKQNKLLLLVLPHNVETAHPTLATQLAALYFQCVARRVEVVWSLSRRRLANCCGVKGKVAVVGVVSGEGCSELLRAAKERAREAREAWGLRGWDERVEAAVRERREREEADREVARRQWQEREAEARREERRKEKEQLAKEMEEARRREELLRAKQAERRVEQQRQAALRRDADERKEQERVADEAEKAKRKARQERTKDDEKGSKQQQGAAKEGKAAEAGGGGGKRTWLEEAAESKEGGYAPQKKGDGSGRSKEGVVKPKSRHK